MTFNPPETPPRSSDVSRNQRLAEAVLAPASSNLFTGHPSDGDLSSGDVSVDLADHHEALIGDEFRNPKNITKQPTLATLGETPFACDGEEVEHHRIVATEIVKDPLEFYSPDNILQNAIVLLDP